METKDKEKLVRDIHNRLLEVAQEQGLENPTQIARKIAKAPSAMHNVFNAKDMMISTLTDIVEGMDITLFDFFDDDRFKNIRE